MPRATYRLQFNRRFTFAQAVELADYLDRLGIGACYASPFLAARPGSLHGYDVTDPAALNPEVGGERDLELLVQALRERGLDLVMDIVPNHLCIASSDNAWWMDVLENGSSSPYARAFDIDWNPPKSDLANKVLLPVLSDQYGRVLENGEIRVVVDQGLFRIEYAGIGFPLAPRTWTRILHPMPERLRERLGESHQDVLELESIMTALTHLPLPTETDWEHLQERTREKEVVRRRLAALMEGNEDVRRALEVALEEVNGRRGDPRSFDRLEALLAEQAYRLCYWRVASDEINYRRFFDISDLAAIRMENPDVFSAVHRLPLQLIGRGWVKGLRVDHVDGLLEPDRYLWDLQRACAQALEDAGVPLKPSASNPNCSPNRPCYLIVEKILVGDERLHADWPVHGTTGYGFLNLLNGIFVMPSHRRRFRRIYERFTGRSQPFPDILYESKKLVMQVSMAGELTMLARKLDRISERHRWSRDFTLNSLQAALVELIACFPVYRTYIRRRQNVVGAGDRAHILAALRAAKRRNPATSRSIFDFIGGLLLLEDPEGLDEEKRAERREFVLRFEQLTSPIMAKGLEDTAFYRYFPLASLNEVGGDPDRFGVTLEVFHRRTVERLRDWPHALSATATHDTKRGEDVRARINALSEIPTEWQRAIHRWHVINLPCKATVDGNEAPDANEEYLLYQTLVGTWPFGGADETTVGRVQDYMVKALKEAKIHTSWIDPDETYERAMRDFVRAVVDRRAFREDFEAFIGPVARAGVLNSLSQVLLKIAAPGVPDFYQGTELWDLSLVDPDNRRPIDYAVRRAHLPSLAGASAKALLDAPEDGRIKMFVMTRALAARRADPELFGHGAYIPVRVTGARDAHVCAFIRRLEDRVAVAAAGRFFLRLGSAPDAWRDTALVLPEELASLEVRDIVTGRSHRPLRVGSSWKLPVADLFAQVPAALLFNRAP
ncbi:MAG: malto-oligosyltrehalose synthase [Planctomycetes bacterium]|nr:malto-oligosyltrehalose synthase [Planctomycetota bacterium]